MLLTLNEAVESDYLANVPVYDFGSDMSISECMIIAVEEQESSFNQIIQSIAVEEMDYFVNNGEEIVYEEGKLNDIKESIVKWIQGVWSKVSGFFAKAIDWVKTKAGADSRFIKKYKDKVLKAKVPADGIDIGKWYAFQNLDKAKDFSNYIKGYFDTLEDDTVENATNKFRGKLIDQDSVAVGDFKKACHKYFFGEEKSGKITGSDINVQELVSELEKSVTSMRDLKNQYKTAKSAFNATIKEVKKIGKSERKNLEGDAKKDNKDNQKGQIKIIKSCMSATSSFYAQLVNAIQARNAQYRAIGRKLAALGGEPTKEEAKEAENKANTQNQESKEESFGYSGDSLAFLSF